MGSLLIAKGMVSGDVPELWNVERASDVQEIHLSYLNNGADAVLTNTFGGTPLRLNESNIKERTKELVSNAVVNARIATNSNQFVIGDIGPTGLFLPPMGKITEHGLFESFKIQATHLINESVDAILIETMSDLREAIAAVKAVRTIDQNVMIIASMTFDLKKKGFFTIMGNNPSSSFSTLEGAGADIVGANCTLDSAQMVQLCKETIGSTNLPLIFQPNAGQPKIHNGEVIYPETPKEFAENLKQMVDLGASIVGGCCGSSPEHIHEASELIKR
ncbi:MAG: methionine synthase I, cobalamin-binding domain-containing protein [Candidatus Heimdallarchaeota archaeon]|nr:methionine synthase I, cobalamin-binding domain-containing protein [Candidatus Heimdallarchaeota archaeon]